MATLKRQSIIPADVVITRLPEVPQPVKRRNPFGKSRPDNGHLPADMAKPPKARPRKPGKASKPRRKGMRASDWARRNLDRAIALRG